MTTLITFLGRGRDDKGTGYRSTTYHFPDGHSDTTAYFGLALARWLDADRVILLGTDSSMWDVLIENLAPGSEEEELRLELMDAVVQKRVDDALLARVQPLVRRALERDCELHTIPHARDAAEQQAILQRLAEFVRSQETLAIDLTHGYRHLGMIGLTAAHFLEATRKVRIQALYYGALDMTDAGRTPVLRLDGLSHIQDWVEALARFDASGDYGVFAPLLVRDGFPEDKARCLEDAAFHESTTQVPLAAQKLQTVAKALESPLKGASELFRHRLLDRIEWVRGNDLARQQHTLAKRALNRGDYLRAAILGIEALITRLCIEADLDPKDYEKREQMNERLQQELREGLHADWMRGAYNSLKTLRNAMAHGTSPNWRSQRELLNNRERLRQELEAQLNRLTNT